MVTPRRRRSLLLALTLVLLCAGVAPSRGEESPSGPRPEDGAAPPGANDWSCVPSAEHPRPVVLVHGLSSTGAQNWAYHSPLVAEAGYCVFALTYGERPDFPSFGGVLAMQESALELDAFVDRVLAATGAAEVDLVGHSEGTVMPQWWLKFLGAADVVRRYVAITPLYDGTTFYGLSTLSSGGSCCPQLAAPFEQLNDSFCASCRQLLHGSAFFQELYGDGVVAMPGVEYTTLMTRYDELVTPWTSGYLDGATNVVLQDLCPLNVSEHGAMAFDPVVTQVILNALDPEHAQPVACGGILGVGFGSLRL